jgi:imidazolonepropionase
VQQADLLIEHAAELCTLAGPPGPRRGEAQGELGIIHDGAVACADGRILAVGTTDEVRSTVELADDVRVIDATGRAVLPGFVDPHTHLVFGGDRVDEFELRLKGADYLDILKAGGGILSTVRATRAAEHADLFDHVRDLLPTMMLHGTTTVEVKSGYGLSTDEELKMLSAVDTFHRWRPPPVRLTTVLTLLAAHAVPPEFSHDPDGYVRLVCEETIPAAAQAKLSVRFCDVFCERGVFTVEQSRRILEAGRTHGLLPKIHAEQKSHFGGAALAAELHAVSADHLEYADDDDLAALAWAGTVGVLVPGAAFMLREQRCAPARRMIELGVPVALATDFNPGTCPILSMQVIVGLACLWLDMTPAEALVAATINAAHAIGEGGRTGSLEPGKRADMVVLVAPSYRHLPYYFAANLVRTVITGGKVAVDRGRNTAGGPIPPSHLAASDWSFRLPSAIP